MVAGSGYCIVLTLVDGTSTEALYFCCDVLKKYSECALQNLRTVKFAMRQNFVMNFVKSWLIRHVSAGALR